MCILQNTHVSSGATAGYTHRPAFRMIQEIEGASYFVIRHQLEQSTGTRTFQ
jgi:hypothetical protein